MNDIAYVKCYITAMQGDVTFTVKVNTRQEETKKPVTIKVDTTDTSITVTATGGSGEYEYSINGGSSWTKENIYENLLAGEYIVLARDANNISNMCAQEVVKITGSVQNVPEGLQNGYYSVDIRVLKEDSDSESMSSRVLNKNK